MLQALRWIIVARVVRFVTAALRDRMGQRRARRRAAARRT